MSRVQQTGALPPRLNLVAGTDVDQEYNRYFEVSPEVRRKIRAIAPPLRMAIAKAQAALDATHEETNAEIEAQEILDALRSALNQIACVIWNSRLRRGGA